MLNDVLELVEGNLYTYKGSPADIFSSIEKASRGVVSETGIKKFTTGSEFLVLSINEFYSDERVVGILIASETPRMGFVVVQCPTSIFPRKIFLHKV